MVLSASSGSASGPRRPWGPAIPSLEIRRSSSSGTNRFTSSDAKPSVSSTRGASLAALLAYSAPLNTEARSMSGLCSAAAIRSASFLVSTPERKNVLSAYTSSPAFKRRFKTLSSASFAVFPTLSVTPGRYPTSIAYARERGGRGMPTEQVCVCGVKRTSLMRATAEDERGASIR